MARLKKPRPRCDMDCFNCPLPECRSMKPLTEWEKWVFRMDSYHETGRPMKEDAEARLIWEQRKRLEVNQYSREYYKENRERILANAKKRHRKRRQEGDNKG